MKTYLFSIIISAIFIILGNTLVNSSVMDISMLEISLLTILTIILMVAIDAVVAILLHEFPKLFFKEFMDKTWFYKAETFPFKTYKFERDLYEKFGIKKWKDLLPNKMGMRKDKLEDKNDTKYLNMFLIENCRAEFMHLLSMFFGFAPLFFLSTKYITITLPVMIVNMILQFLPVLVQRYNRPKIMILIKRAKRNQTQEIIDNEKRYAS